MKKYLLSLACFAAWSAQAQNVYNIEQVSTQDLIGTARFVGMGGAMNALGADLSTMSGNPAAMGLYRRNDIGFTASVLSQKDAQRFGDTGKTRGSFDQIGGVWTMRTGNSTLPFFNIGFNYQKSHNLKQYIGTGWQSFGTQTSQLHQLADQLYGAAIGTHVGSLADYPDYNAVVSNAAYDAGLIDMTFGTDSICTDVLSPNYSEKYNYQRANWGFVNEYDFNLSTNIKDRLYLGLTIGIYEVKSKSALYYQEDKINGANMGYGLSEETSLRGTGFDVKFGAIARPFEDNPLRIGLAFHTPRRLTLTQEKYCQFDIDAPIFYDQPDLSRHSTGNYDYNIRTPWRIQASMATTISDWLALDAEYEAALFKGSAISYPKFYDWTGSAQYAESDRDDFISDEIGYCLRQQHTIRVGAEARIVKNFYARLGYNFVTSAFKDEAFLNIPPAETYNNKTIVVNSTYNATATDYVNLGNTHRVSLGLGWHGKHCYFDAAYLCQNQKADMYAFDNIALAPFSTNLVRQSGIFTFGVKF